MDGVATPSRGVHFPPVWPLTLLCFGDATAAPTAVFTLAATLTNTRVDGLPRLGFDLSLAGQVLPVNDHRQQPTPSVGAAVHRRWLDREHRRWLVGARVGVNWLNVAFPVLHYDFASTEFEMGGAVGAHRRWVPYLGAHATGLIAFGLGWDIEVTPEPEARFPTTSLAVQLPIPPVFPVEGRPLRVGAGRLVPRVLHRADAPARWIAAGREELASVGTFLRLRAELRALGSPASLVERAGHAAREELGHAAMCFGMAGGAVATFPPWTPRRFASAGHARGVLGQEARVDGCHNEGEAVRRAERDAIDAPDARAHAVHAQIAREERGHAAFGAEVARWCGVSA